MKRGLVLGGGGVRGVAHIGVLEALEEKEIDIHHISGNSAGAIIGAFYASGMTPEEMYEAVVNVKPYKVFELPSLKKFKSLLGTRGVKTFLEKHLGDTTFEDLEIPLVVNALDINTGEIVYIDSGRVADAVKASISLPAIFSPVKREGKYLVDAGSLDPVPVEGLPDCDEYICVDVSAIDIEIDEYSSVKDVFRKFIYILQKENMNHHIPPKENMVTIAPQTKEWLMLDMRNYEGLREEGRRAALEKLNSDI